MDYVYFGLKVLHVFLAVLWVGGGVFNLFLIQRLLAQSTLPTRREFSGRLFPAALRYFNAVGGFTLLTGAGLVSLHPHGWGGLADTRWGRTILFSLIASLLVLYLLNVAIRPTIKALAKAAEEMPPGSEPPAGIRFLQARLRFALYLATGILLLILVLMVYANSVYFGPPQSGS